MARPLDPYRTLEVQRDATLDEVKAAYRRMAKRYHPDSAGAGALPRFLAIQAAYESLTDGPARLRLGAARPRATTRNRRTGDADHDRSRTSSDAGMGQDRRAGRSGSESRANGAAGATGAAGETGATGRRAGASAGSSTRAGGAGSAGGAGGAGGASTGAGRSSGASSGTGPPGATGGRARRARRSPTSTSYDGMEGQPFEPEWEGASWYGGSSGTYWTLNPKEFADPRKHGPEYLARGRHDRSRPLAHRRPRGDPGDGPERPGPAPATSAVDGDEAASDDVRAAAAAAETAAAAATAAGTGEPAGTATATEAARTASAGGWTTSAGGWTTSAGGWTDSRAPVSAPASAAVGGIDSASDPGTLSEPADEPARSAGSGRLAAIAIATAAAIAGVVTMLVVLYATAATGTFAGSALALVVVAALVATVIVVGRDLRGPGRRRT
ncbi:MAG: J domain-containing protein [Candidatus Limnocylindrales bacterium]